MAYGDVLCYTHLSANQHYNNKFWRWRNDAKEKRVTVNTQCFLDTIDDCCKYNGWLVVSCRTFLQVWLGVHVTVAAGTSAAVDSIVPSWQESTSITDLRCMSDMTALVFVWESSGHKHTKQNINLHNYIMKILGSVGYIFYAVHQQYKNISTENISHHFH